MTEVLTAAQMRTVEQNAIRQGRVTGLELMERAGQGVVEAIIDEWPELAHGARRALVLCGPGNNGGDGFVVARLLKARGWDIEVFLHGDAKRLPPDAKANAVKWQNMGEIKPFGTTGLLSAVSDAKSAGHEVIVVVDALFGIGQRPPLDDVLSPLQEVIDEIFGKGRGPAPIFVSIDLPTGYDADTGAALARSPAPFDLVVTFHRPKPIHVMPHFMDARLKVVDIGL